MSNYAITRHNAAIARTAHIEDAQYYQGLALMLDYEFGDVAAIMRMLVESNNALDKVLLAGLDRKGRDEVRRSIGVNNKLIRRLRAGLAL